jgi:hypothetical protein
MIAKKLEYAKWRHCKIAMLVLLLNSRYRPLMKLLIASLLALAPLSTLSRACGHCETSIVPQTEKGSIVENSLQSLLQTIHMEQSIANMDACDAFKMSLGIYQVRKYFVWENYLFFEARKLKPSRSKETAPRHRDFQAGPWMTYRIKGCKVLPQFIKVTISAESEKGKSLEAYDIRKLSENMPAPP